MYTFLTFAAKERKTLWPYWKDRKRFNIEKYYQIRFGFLREWKRKLRFCILFHRNFTLENHVQNDFLNEENVKFYFYVSFAKFITIFCRTLRNRSRTYAQRVRRTRRITRYTVWFDGGRNPVTIIPALHGNWQKNTRCLFIWITDE